ncbi:MAG: 50S ribosomal protein L3 N(5)-glutamine methyltransferase [Bauldia sp.]|nr:50S ribosomal protein L3 N(5)-glutamine methyltransferase [Bauldia sp.]
MAKQKEPPAELLTVRDFWRWAVSRFSEAGLAYGQGTTNAADEAAFLVLETLHLPIDRLDPFLDARLTAAERKAVAAIVDARVRTRKPASYLTGTAYIQGVRFRVDPRAIVPRALIGELIAAGIADPDGLGLIADAASVETILDLCTGTACLAILAAMDFPAAMVDAVELAPGTAELARLNIADHGLSKRVRLLEGDLWAPVARRRYDLILANPPYVDAAAMAALPPEFRHEPALALDGGRDGLAIVRRIIDRAAKHLKPGGGLLCEVGSQRARVEAAYPDLDFLWLDTEETEGEVFWLSAEAAGVA